MAMKRCPVCGEKYSDTYAECPFCEEEKAFQDGEQIRRGGGHGGRRAAGRQQMNLITPTLIVLILIMAGLLVYLLWGDKIADSFQSKEETQTPPWRNCSLRRSSLLRMVTAKKTARANRA